MSFFQLPWQLRTYHSYVLTVGFHHHGNPVLFFLVVRFWLLEEKEKTEKNTILKLTLPESGSCGCPKVYKEIQSQPQSYSIPSSQQ